MEAGGAQWAETRKNHTSLRSFAAISCISLIHSLNLLKMNTFFIIISLKKKPLAETVFRPSNLSHDEWFG
jgi:hypothetical protein